MIKSACRAPRNEKNAHNKKDKIFLCQYKNIFNSSNKILKQLFKKQNELPFQ
jgi:hypothetical protein